MDASYFITTKVPCPHCGKEVEARNWLIIDTSERPDLLREIKEARLRNPHCPHCDSAYCHLDAPLFLYRRTKMPRLLFSPATRLTFEQNRAEADRLAARLRNALGSEWRDDWLAQVQVNNVSQLPAVLAVEEGTGTALTTTEEIRLLLAQSGDLGQRLRELGNATSLTDMRELIDVHPELLTDEADSILSRMLKIAQAECADFLVFFFADRLTTLRQCRMLGVEKAFEDKFPISNVDIPIPEEFRERVSAASNNQRTQYGLYSNLDALNEAVAGWEQIINDPKLTSTPVAFQAVALDSFAQALRERYRAAGADADMEAAHRKWQEALALTSEDSVMRLGLLNNYCTSLLDRYWRSGSLSDLDGAIEVCRDVVNATHFTFAALPGYVNNLGYALRTKYYATKAPNVVEDAIAAFERAVLTVSYTSLERTMFLFNLGSTLLSRYYVKRKVEDIERGVELIRKVLAIPPFRSPHRAMYLDGLALGLHLRYQSGSTKTISDLDEALEALDQAFRIQTSGGRVDLDSPGWADRLASAAALYKDKYDATRSNEDFEPAITYYKAACDNGLKNTPQSVSRVARNWGEWAWERRDWEEATEAFGYGMKAAVVLFRNQLLRRDKETWLRDAQGFASHAAYALARAGNPREAAVALETGRTMLLREALEHDRLTRSLEQVKEQHPEAYELYRRASEKLRLLGGFYAREEVPIADFDQPEFLSEKIQQAQQELDTAAEMLRSIPGLEDLFSVPDFDDIAEAVKANHPLAYLVCTDLGSMILMVSQNIGTPDHATPSILAEALWADEFKIDNLNGLFVRYEGEQVVGGLLPAQLDEPLLLRDELNEILPTLGKAVVAQLAARLKEIKADGVTLVPVGLFSLLPLHASRYNVDGKNVRLFDEFNVAYSPSAAAVVLRGRRESPARRLLALGNPRGKDVSPAYFTDLLASAMSEAAASGPPLLYEEASVKAFREALSSKPPEHLLLGCHGLFEPSKPMDSGLYLADGRLTIAELINNVRLPSTTLVILCACQTAITDFRNLPDEAIGLPAALLHAGARSVVATLWSVHALPTAILLKHFYDEVAAGVGAAAALRGSTAWLRTLDRDSFLALLSEMAIKADAETRTMLEEAATAFQGQSPFINAIYWAAFTYNGPP